jgi:hypothetical protein
LLHHALVPSLSLLLLQVQGHWVLWLMSINHTALGPRHGCRCGRR